MDETFEYKIVASLPAADQTKTFSTVPQTSSSDISKWQMPKCFNNMLAPYRISELNSRTNILLNVNTFKMVRYDYKQNTIFILGHSVSNVFIFYNFNIFLFPPSQNISKGGSPNSLRCLRMTQIKNVTG